MSLQIDAARDEAGRHHLALSGALDLATHSAVVTAARSAVAQEPQVIVLDLAGVTFIDSTGFRALVETSRVAELAGTSVVLKDPAPRIVKLLDVIGLRDHWAIES